MHTRGNHGGEKLGLKTRKTMEGSEDLHLARQCGQRHTHHRMVVGMSGQRCLRCPFLYSWRLSFPRFLLVCLGSLAACETFVGVTFAEVREDRECAAWSFVFICCFPCLIADLHDHTPICNVPRCHNEGTVSRVLHLATHWNPVQRRQVVINVISHSSIELSFAFPPSR